MRAFLKVTVIVPIILLISCQNSIDPTGIVTKQTTQPNFIFIITDDMDPTMFNNLPQGKDEHGKVKNLTPNIDLLIRTGSFLSETYVASPVCTPSRYNVLTGNYASRAKNEEFIEFTRENKGQTVIQWNSFIVPGVDETIGSHLQRMGYRTGFVGKNHVVESLEQIDHTEEPDLYADPNDAKIRVSLEYRYKELQKDIQYTGFDFADGLYHNNPRWLGIDALAVQNMDWITEAGVNFLDKDDGRPFFLYFATTLPHAPTNPTSSWLADPRITPKGILENAPNVQLARNTLTPRVNAVGIGGKNRENILWLDDAIGVLLKKLTTADKLDETIIIFFNDHGQFAKGSLYEGGLHTQAFMWRKAGFSCGAVCNVRVSNIDFLETVVEMAGGKEVESYSDGKSFLGALNGKTRAETTSHYFELGYARAIVKGNYKYLALRYPEGTDTLSVKERQVMLDKYNDFRMSFGAKPVNFDPTLPFGHLEMVPGGGGAENRVFGSRPEMFEPDQLYNIKLDPNETHNLANDSSYSDVLKDMKFELSAYLDELPGEFKLSND